MKLRNRTSYIKSLFKKEMFHIQKKRYMDRKEILISFWQDVARQNESELKSYFTTDAYIRWNDTNEEFSVEEYIIANCEYPGDWHGEVERIELMNDLAITVTRVWLSDGSTSFHVVSFFEFQEDKIAVLNEYWGEDGAIPQWRLDKLIGRPIK